MMNEKNKMECNELLKVHELTQKLLGANVADASMLAILVEMARDGKMIWRCICFTISNLMPSKSKMTARKKISRKLILTLTNCLTPCSTKQ